MRNQILPAAAPAFFSLIVWIFFSGFAPSAAGAHALAISPDGRRLYVTGDFPKSGIDVIDTQTNAVSTTLPITVPTLDAGFHAPLALSPDGSVLYAESDLLSLTPFTVDLATGKLTATVPTMRLVQSEQGSTGDLAVSPDGRRLYMLGGDRLTNLAIVSVVDTVSKRIVAAIPVFGASEALTPDGTKLYITGGYSGGGGGVVTVVDALAKRLIGTINVQPMPGGIASSPDGGLMYVTHNDPGSVTVDIINTISGTLDKTHSPIPGGASLAPVVSPDGKRLYELPLSWNMVAAVSTSGSGVLGAIGVGGYPIDQVVSPGGDRLYVLRQSTSISPGGSISVVDTSTFQVIATIDLRKAAAVRQ